jgi:PIN domain nuclease of toxin-antitoxin system
MTLFLNTHAILWFALNDSSLSGTAMFLILDISNEHFMITPS